MENNLIERLNIYENKLNYNKFLNYFEIKKSNDIKSWINDLNAPLYTMNILNLGKELFNLFSFQMNKWTFFTSKNYDRLEDEIKYYDITNNLIVSTKLKKWYRNNIKPFYKNIENKLNDYSFAALCIRLFLICQAIDKTTTMLNEKPHKKSKCLEDKYGLQHDDWFYIFNDYLISDFDEKKYNAFCNERLKLTYKDVSIEKIREYAYSLFNELNKKYNLLNIKCALFYDINTKKNIALYYHLTPISVVYNHLISKLANKESKIKQCKYCNHFMEVEKSSKEYHDECYVEKDKERKR